ncbi:sugar transferase [Oceanobacillus halophilus]|uniref:Sugar transferase n=1 Tax=Oceanobacillus halophilus TaxID=930130 RepID=A0A494ZZ53_9BACI|nr:sugar transferase [Oceanobacillus halophilus]RKQ31412.1 sugar transferase [Oceanobacillus halophilus]
MENINSTNLVKDRRLYLIWKRIIDILVSSFLLVFFCPLFLFICYRIYKKEGGPIFYREVRVGKNQRNFIMYSFRMMTNPSRIIWALPPYPISEKWKEGVPDEFSFQNDKQCTMTPTGIWLKKYNLQLLPRLWNVLKGDISLVGPMPEKKEIVDCYNDWQQKRLMVKPGLTGYARITRGDNMKYTERIHYDLFYIQNRSLKMDLKILWSTIKGDALS